MEDDDRTPVASPRRRRSSVSVSTAELVLEQLAARLSLPALSPERMADVDRDDAVAIVLDHCRIAVHRALAAEKRETERIREELRATEERLAIARSAAVRHEP